MCPVLCDPPRHADEYEPLLHPGRRRTRRAVGLLACVLLAATPILYHSDPGVVRQLTERFWLSRPVALARDVTRPASRLVTGDVRPMQSWVNNQTTPRLLVLASLGVCVGMYLMLRD